MKVAVLIPHRPDNGRRDEVWAYVRSRWANESPDFKIVEGQHADGPFNRSKAINAAAKKAGKFDIAIIADSDSFVGKPQIDAAIELAARTDQMVLAYDRFCYVNVEMSNQIMAGFAGNWYSGVEWTMTGTCSSMVIVSRKLWLEAEGFDEGYVGWGGEDIAFSHKAQTFGNGLHRIPGEVWHLWHPPAVHADNDTWVPRCERYARASYKPDEMRALMAELKAEDAAARG